MQKPFLSISIVSFNTKRELHKCLRSIFQNAPSSTYDVWVVDNASSDGSATMVEKEFPQVKLIRNPINVYYAAAQNQVLKSCRAKYVLTLNSDTRILPRSLTTALTFLENHPKIGALSIIHQSPTGKIDLTCQRFPTPVFEIFSTSIFAKWLPKPGIVRDNRYPGWDRTTSRGDVDVLPGACLFLRRKALVDIGYFDQRLRLFFPDTDLCQRLKQAGWHLYYLASCAVIHTQAASLHHFSTYRTNVFYIHDALIFYRKYFGIRWWILLFLVFKFNYIYYLFSALWSKIAGD